MEPMIVDKAKTRSTKTLQSTLSICNKSGALSYSSTNSIESFSPIPPNNYLHECSNGGLNKIEVTRGQRRLHDLKGVVVIKQIKGYLEKLKSPDVPIDKKLEIIKHLQEKTPSTKILQSSGLGTLIRNIAKSSPDQENVQSIMLMKESKKLYRHWKRLIEKRIDQNLVSTMKNINITERQNHVKKLQEACKTCLNKDGNDGGDNNSALSVSNTAVNRIEQYVFNLTGKFIGTYYRRLMEKLISDIKENKSGLFQKIFIFNGKVLMVDTGYDKISKGARVDYVLKEHLNAFILESS